MPERRDGHHVAAEELDDVVLSVVDEDLDARVLGFDEVHGLGFLPRALEVADLLEQWLDARADDAAEVGVGGAREG